MLSTGSGGNVFCFQSSSASDTGWTQTQLPLHGSQVAAGITNAGTLIVLTPSGNTLAYVEQDTAGNWDTASKGITGIALAVVDVIGDESVAIMQLAMGSARPRPQIAGV